MPPKKPVEPRSKVAESDRLLQYGPKNNIIAWRDRMEEECVEMYGMTGTFFSTDEAYEIPYPAERDFHPFPEMLGGSGSDSDEDFERYAVAPSEPGTAEEGPIAPPTTPGLD